MSNKKLSRRAAAMLERIRNGHWYSWTPSPGPALSELLDAGLIEVSARVEKVRAAYALVGVGDPHWTLKSEWRDMESAPHNDDPVLLLLPDGRQMSGVRHNGYGRPAYAIGWRNRSLIIVFPLFWRPLLPPPPGYMAVETGEVYR